jgi:hypothetical protein
LTFRAKGGDHGGGKLMLLNDTLHCGLEHKQLIARLVSFLYFQVVMAMQSLHKEGI